MPQPAVTASSKIAVASTGNDAEVVDRVPIARASSPPATRQVVLSLGPGAKTDLPLPALQPGDRLRIFVELEVTTDYANATDKGLIGHPYSYAPVIKATLLLANAPEVTAPARGRAIAVGSAWSGSCSQRQHHRVITFGNVGYTVPLGGLGWNGPAYINVALSAANPAAQSGDVLLIGQNELDPVVVGDMAGIRVVLMRPAAAQPGGHVVRTTTLLTPTVSVEKRAAAVFSQPIRGLARGEQLLVCGRVRASSARLRYVARLSNRMFLADSPTQTEPSRGARSLASWNGQLSKPNGFNCLPEEGPQVFSKFGVLKILKAPGKPMYVNLASVGGRPLGGGSPGDQLPLLTGGFLEVTRFSPARAL